MDSLRHFSRLSFIFSIPREKFPQLTSFPCGLNGLLAGRRYLFITLLVACSLYIPGQRHGLYRTVDAREAEIAREMLASGNLSVPTLNGEVFLEKPPLFAAAVALSFKLFGVSETAARVPSAVFAVLSLLGLAVLGTRLKDRRLGVFMALFLGTDMFYLSWGHEVRLDLALAGFVIWSLVAFLAAYSPGQEKARLGPLIAFYALVTAAFMTKGVVGSLVPALTVMTYLICRRDFKGLWRIKPWLGILLFVALAGPWHYALFEQAGSRYFEIFYRDNHLYRFIHSSEVNLGHRKPWYIYLVNEWHDFLPWSLLFPAAFLSFFRSGYRAWLGRDSFIFVVSWLVPAFIFFSASSTKQSSYLLPIYGAYGAVVGSWVLWKMDEEGTPAWEKVYILLFAWTMTVTALAVPALAIRGHQGSWIAFGLCAFLPLAVAFSTARAAVRHRHDPKQTLLPAMAAVFFTTFFGAIFLLPQANAGDDFSGPSRAIAAMTRSEPAVYCMDNSELEMSFLGFYCRRHIAILGLPPRPELLPGAGIRIPVASVACGKDLIQRRRKALEDAGMRVEEALANINGNKYTTLWWVSPEQESPSSGPQPRLQLFPTAKP